MHNKMQGLEVFLRLVLFLFFFFSHLLSFTDYCYYLKLVYPGLQEYVESLTSVEIGLGPECPSKFLPSYDIEKKQTKPKPNCSKENK